MTMTFRRLDFGGRGKMKMLVGVVLCGIVLHAVGFAEAPQSIMRKPVPERPVTGNLRVDLFSEAAMATSPSLTQEGDVRARPHKSPLLAAGMSLLIPGAGQVYTEHYWEAGAFLAADIAAWLLAVKYDQKGDRQTDFFQNYANAHWDVVKYALFSESNYPTGRTYPGLIKAGTEGLPPWQRVNWDVLNQMERDIGSLTGTHGQFYSHTLPPYGDQQYYELIGKYQEFYQGWDDADASLVEYEDISARLHSSPSNMIYYSKERGYANDYYATASTWVKVAVINHVVNAVYAALSASWYNKAHAELGMQQIPTERGMAYVPTVTMKIAF
jgi:hypothetical protein